MNCALLSFSATTVSCATTSAERFSKSYDSSHFPYMLTGLANGVLVSLDNNRNVARNKEIDVVVLTAFHDDLMPFFGNSRSSPSSAIASASAVCATDKLLPFEGIDQVWSAIAFKSFFHRSWACRS